ncbi:MAG: nucleotidyltransferase domain-containing protein [Nanoarchaeota archaeon]|nr:nucleotidyltransferase domain-containing protein [Nanoarchaeota archaeon]
MVKKKIEPRVISLTKDRDIAMDFAQKVYKRIGTPIKSIVLFGSATKGNSNPKSDIDIIILLDDASISWDDELVAWYREELGKIIASNKYIKPLHINTVRITTWWNEMIRGEPVIINIIRWGDPLIDLAGFFTPLKSLLVQGHLKSTPEMIFVTLGRAPAHLGRCKANMIGAMESIYWAFVDASHSALIAAKVSPPSPEHIPSVMRQNLVDRGIIKGKYVDWYREVYILTHKVMRGETDGVKGEDLQLWKERADEYIKEMAIAVKKITGLK